MDEFLKATIVGVLNLSACLHDAASSEEGSSMKCQAARFLRSFTCQMSPHLRWCQVWRSTELRCSDSCSMSQRETSAAHRFSVACSGRVRCEACPSMQGRVRQMQFRYFLLQDQKFKRLFIATFTSHLGNNERHEGLH